MRRAWLATGLVYGLLLFAFFGPAFGLGLGFFLVASGGVGAGIAVIAAVAAVVGIYVAWLTWYVRALQRSFAYHADADTLTIRRGVVFRRTSRIPLRRVQDVVTRDGPFLRAARVGTVHVQTAGMHVASGPAMAAEGIMPGLEHPDVVAKDILDRVRALRGDV